MKPITPSTIKLLARSGFVLIILSMLGSVAIAAVRISGPVQENWWQQMIGTMSFAVAGIAVYYISLAALAWLFVRKKNKAP
jgi:LPXTG-motif cell wall-anchored protein